MSSRLEELQKIFESRYLIEQEIGRGEFADVYLAQDLDNGKQIALKVVFPELTARIDAEKFLEKIGSFPRLDHPHILPIQESGTIDGHLYLAMPFVAGETLKERLDRGVELPLSRTLALMREVADAVAFAHSSGIVHLDIRPGNVMVSDDRSLVTDFGVVQAITESMDPAAAPPIGLTSPAHRAPEAAAVGVQQDHRSDIYSLGVLGYELLAGQPPFSAPSEEELLALHATQDPEPIATRRAGVSPDLEAIVMKCLAKDPADRWQNAEEISAPLDRSRSSLGSVIPEVRADASHPAARAGGPAVPIVLAASVLLLLFAAECALR